MTGRINDLFIPVFKMSDTLHAAPCNQKTSSL